MRRSKIDTGHVVDHIAVEPSDVALFTVAKPLRALHEGDEGCVVFVHGCKNVYQGHDTVDTKACGIIVDRELHLMRAKDRVSAKGVRDVMCLARDP